MCAYNPGITDQSGMLRAQGKIAQAEGIASGFSGGFRTYSQNKLRNQVLQAENEGLLKAFMSDPETAKYAPEGIDKFLMKVEKGGGLGLDENIRLNGMLNSALKTRGVIGEQKQRQQQMAVQQQQMEAAKLQQQQNAFVLQQTQREAAQQAEMDARNKGLAQFSQGVGAGVYSPQAQGAMNAQMQTNPQAALLARIMQQTRDPSVIREMLQAAQPNGGAPTTAMRDTDAIINSELSSGKIKPEQVQARKAELLAAGGRDPGSRFDNAGTFVDVETGSNARTAVKDRTTGKIGYVDGEGKFQPLDPTKWKPSTVGDTNALLDPPGMEKLREKVIDGERSIRGLTRYLSGFENLQQGAGQLADRLIAATKTVMDKKPLTEEEKAAGIQKGRLQSILGGLRTTIVGPGVMTEIDAQRILNAVGGDVSSTQNQQVVRQLVGEVLAERLNQYESDLDVYNTHVARKYGGQAGYKQRDKVPVEFKAPSAQPAAAAAVITPLSAAEQKRLEELRAKYRK